MPHQTRRPEKIPPLKKPLIKKALIKKAPQAGAFKITLIG